KPHTRPMRTKSSVLSELARILLLALTPILLAWQSRNTHQHGMGPVSRDRYLEYARSGAGVGAQSLTNYWPFISYMLAFEDEEAFLNARQHFWNPKGGLNDGISGF